MMNVDAVLFVADIIAVIVFAISGLIEAARKNMDMVGVFTVAFVTALGGGTLRDVLLDRRPLVWVEHQEYIWMILGLALLGPPLLRLCSNRWVDLLLQATDAIGLGLFAASGASLGLIAGMPWIVVVILGVITGAFGGVIRDVLCNEIPTIFRDHRPYALCAFWGCWAFVVMQEMGVPAWLTLLLSAGITASLRILALVFNWRLPQWPPRPSAL